MPFVTESREQPKSDEEEAQHKLRAHEVTGKLRALFENHVLPIVMNEFPSLFRHVYAWQKAYDVHFFSGPITSIGLAELFWPRAHQDKDTWYTILVCLDLGAGLERGGDFSFCTHGHVLEARDGDVFIFNPLYHHSCTEPHPRPQGSRLFISFYCKKDVVTAAALSAAIKARKGNAPLVLNL